MGWLERARSALIVPADQRGGRGGEPPADPPCGDTADAAGTTSQPDAGGGGEQGGGQRKQPTIAKQVIGAVATIFVSILLLRGGCGGCNKEPTSTVDVKRGGKQVEIIRPTLVDSAGTRVDSLRFDAKEDCFWTEAFAVEKGKLYRISASGKVQWTTTLGNRKHEIVTANGAPWSPQQMTANQRPADYLALDAPCGSLVGAIGELKHDKKTRWPYVKGTAPFFIGEHRIFRAPITGVLYIAMNERQDASSTSDNAWYWTIIGEEVTEK